MAFKLPYFTKKAIVNKVTDLPQFRNEDPKEIGIVERGLFGVVVKAKHLVHGYVSDTVVVKKLLEDRVNNQKELIKEARMLHSIQHENIVSFKAFCQRPCAIMLECVCFDFSPFGDDINKKVHSLREFLGFVDKQDALESFNECGFVTKIAKDVASGLCYLHSKDIVHRDLKTANVLVSNQHYGNITTEEDLSKALQENPIMCKVTDFGESRSRLVQTALAVHSRTQRINRGTPVFLAPEAFLAQPKSGVTFSISDMKKVDIWAYGMVLFNVLNPDMRHPFQVEFESPGSGTPVEKLKELLTQQRKPCFSGKYKHLQATDWLYLEGVYHECTAWEQQRRPTASEVVFYLEKWDKESLCDNVPLGVSQASSVEAFGHDLALKITVDGSKIQQHMAPANDGTSACAFLCAQIAHDLHMSEERKCGCIQPLLAKLPSLVEKIINELPVTINQVRTRDLCHVDEAYGILCQIGSVSCDYEFTEKVLHCHHIFSPQSRECLRKAVINMTGKEKFCTALFCCEPYIFLVGVMSGKLFLIDTHPVNQDLGGNGYGGQVKVYHSCSPKAYEALCGWICNRLRVGGGLTEKARHSFLLMSPETR